MLLTKTGNVITVGSYLGEIIPKEYIYDRRNEK